MHIVPRQLVVIGAITALVLSAMPSSSAADQDGSKAAQDVRTSIPIKHLVVIFQENVSFDHYFGTYPNALNPAGEPAFHAADDTPTVSGLTGPLLNNNPNLSNPQRLSRAQAATCDQDHGYTHEQQAYDLGLMDLFVQDTGKSLTLQQCLSNEGNPAPASGTNPNYAVMDYYDGNTVTALWNYAQHFSMSDNSYSDTFGPSTPGAMNVIAGNTFGAICGPTSAVIQAPACTSAPGSVTATPGIPLAQGPGTTFSDADPNYDVCSSTQDTKTAAQTIQMGGKNVGDLLNAESVTWGWFQGGFASPNYVPGNPSSDDLKAVCTGSHKNILGASQVDYNPHHEPFQYYQSTANPQHLPPTSVAAIGHQDQANHQYDLKDFFAAVDQGSMPAVSYLKAADYQDGHAGYSNPLDEQTFLTDTINHLEKAQSWRETAVIILYDDSDGWYDHQFGPVVTQSKVAGLDALNAAGQCGTTSKDVPSGQQGRCGVGMRQPLLTVSPFSKSNYVDGTLTTQASVVQFIEDNWLASQRIGNGSVDASTGSLKNLFDFGHGNRDQRLFLDASTGEPTNPGD
jgi:phospholipase C